MEIPNTATRCPHCQGVVGENTVWCGTGILLGILLAIVLWHYLGFFGGFLYIVSAPIAGGLIGAFVDMSDNANKRKKYGD